MAKILKRDDRDVRGDAISKSTEHFRVKAWVVDQLDRVVDEFHI